MVRYNSEIQPRWARLIQLNTLKADAPSVGCNAELGGLMGISGTHVDTFEDGNLAICAGMHLDADYPHTFFDIMGVEGQEVILKSHRDGSEYRLERQCDDGREYCEMEQKSSFEKMLGKSAKTFKVVPMDGSKS